MTAIDFATHLAKAILTADLSMHESATLFCLAAGLDTAGDTSRQLDQPRNTISTALNKLTQKGLARPATWLDDGTPVYRLTPAGKELLAHHFLASIPKNKH